MSTTQWACLLLAVTGVSLAAATCDTDQSKMCLAAHMDSMKQDMGRGDMNDTMQSLMKKLSSEFDMEMLFQGEAMIKGFLGSYNITMPYSLRDVMGKASEMDLTMVRAILGGMAGTGGKMDGSGMDFTMLQAFLGGMTGNATSSMDLSIIRTMLSKMLSGNMTDVSKMDWSMMLKGEDMLKGFLEPFNITMPYSVRDVMGMVSKMDFTMMRAFLGGMTDSDGKMDGSEMDFTMLRAFLGGMSGNGTSSMDLSMIRMMLSKMMSGNMTEMSQMEWSMMGTQLVQKLAEMGNALNKTSAMEALKMLESQLSMFNITLEPYGSMALDILSGIHEGLRNMNMTSDMGNMNGTSATMVWEAIREQLAKSNLDGVVGPYVHTISTLASVIDGNVTIASLKTLWMAAETPITGMLINYNMSSVVPYLSTVKHYLSGLDDNMELSSAMTMMGGGNFNISLTSATELWGMAKGPIQSQLAMFNLSSAAAPYLEMVNQVVSLVDGNVSASSVHAMWKMVEGPLKMQMMNYNMTAGHQVVSTISGLLSALDSNMTASTIPWGHLLQAATGVNMSATASMTPMQTGHAMFAQLWALLSMDNSTTTNASMALQGLQGNLTAMSLMDPTWMDTYLAGAITMFGDHLREWCTNTTDMLTMMKQQMSDLNKTLSQDPELQMVFELIAKHNLTEKAMFNWTAWGLEYDYAAFWNDVGNQLLQIHEEQTAYMTSLIQNYTQNFIQELNDTIQYINMNKTVFFEQHNITEKIAKDVDEFVKFLTKIDASGVYSNLTGYLQINNANNLSALISDLQMLKASPASFLAAGNETQFLQSAIAMLQNRNISDMFPKANITDFEYFLTNVAIPLKIADNTILQLKDMYGPFWMDVMANVTMENVTQLVQRIGMHYHINTNYPSLVQWSGYSTVLITNLVMTYVDLSTFTAPENIVLFGNMSLQEIFNFDVGGALQMLQMHANAYFNTTLMAATNALLDPNSMMMMMNMSSNDTMMAIFTNPQVGNLTMSILEVIKNFKQSNETQQMKEWVMWYVTEMLELNQTKMAIRQELMTFNYTIHAFVNKTSSMFADVMPSLNPWMAALMDMFSDNSSSTNMSMWNWGEAWNSYLTGSTESWTADKLTQWWLGGNMTVESWLTEFLHKAKNMSFEDWFQANNMSPHSWFMGYWDKAKNMSSESWMMGMWGKTKNMSSESWMMGMFDKTKNMSSESWMKGWWDKAKNMSSESWMMGLWDKGKNSSYEDWHKAMNMSLADYWEKVKTMSGGWARDNSSMSFEQVAAFAKEHIAPVFAQAALLGSWDDVNKKQMVGGVLDMVDSGMAENMLRYGLSSMVDMDMSSLVMVASMIDVKDIKPDPMWLDWDSNKTFGEMYNKSEMWSLSDMMKEGRDKMGMVLTKENEDMFKMIVGKMTSMMGDKLKGSRKEKMETVFSILMGAMKGVSFDFSNSTDKSEMWAMILKNTTMEEWSDIISGTNVSDYFPRCNDDKESKMKMPMMDAWPMMTMPNFYMSAYAGAYAMSYVMSWLAMENRHMNKTALEWKKNMTDSKWDADKMNGTWNESWYDFEKGMKLVQKLSEFQQNYGKLFGFSDNMLPMMMMKTGKMEMTDPLTKNIQRLMMFSNVAHMVGKFLMVNETKNMSFDISATFYQIAQINQMLEYAKPKLDADQFDFSVFARNAITKALVESFMEEMMENMYQRKNMSESNEPMAMMKNKEKKKMFILLSGMLKPMLGGLKDIAGNFSAIDDEKSFLFPIIAHTLYEKVSMMMMPMNDTDNDTKTFEDGLGAMLFAYSLLKPKERHMGEMDSNKSMSGMDKKMMTMWTIKTFVGDMKRQAALLPGFTSIMNMSMPFMSMMKSNETEKSMNGTDHHMKRNDTVGNCTMSAIMKAVRYLGEHAKYATKYGGEMMKNATDYGGEMMKNATDYASGKAKNATDYATNKAKNATKYVEEMGKTLGNATRWLANMTGACDKNDPHCKNASLKDIRDKMDGMINMVKAKGVCSFVKPYVMMPSEHDSFFNILSYTASLGGTGNLILMAAGGFSTNPIVGGTCGNGYQQFDTAIISSMAKLMSAKRMLGYSEKSTDLMKMKNAEALVKQRADKEIPDKNEDKKSSGQNLQALLIGAGHLDVQQNKLDLGSLGSLNMATNAITQSPQCDVNTVLYAAWAQMNTVYQYGVPMMQSTVKEMITNYTMMIMYKLHEMTEMAHLDAESRNNFTLRIKNLDMSGMMSVMKEAKMNFTEKMQEMMDDNMVNVTEAFGKDFDLMQFMTVVSVLDEINMTSYSELQKPTSKTDLVQLSALITKQKNFNATKMMNQVMEKFVEQSEIYNFNMTEILLNMTTGYRTFDLKATYIEPLYKASHDFGSAVMWVMNETSSCMNEMVTASMTHFGQLYSNMSASLEKTVKETFNVPGGMQANMKDFSVSNLTFASSHLGKTLTAAGKVRMHDKESQGLMEILNSYNVYAGIIAKGQSMMNMFMPSSETSEQDLKTLVDTGSMYLSSLGYLQSSNGGLMAALGNLAAARAEVGGEKLKTMMSEACMVSANVNNANQCISNSIDTCNASVQLRFKETLKPVMDAYSGSVISAMCSSGCEAALDLSECVAMESENIDRSGQATRDATVDLNKISNTKVPADRTKRGVAVGLQEKSTSSSGTVQNSNNMCQVFTNINMCVKTKITGCQALEQSYTATMQPFLEAMVPECGQQVVEGITDSTTQGVVEVTTSNFDDLGNNGATGTSGQVAFFLAMAAITYVFLRQ